MKQREGLSTLSRRELLKLLGVSAAGTTVVGSLAGCEQLGALWERQPVIPVEAWHKGVCRFCGTGCGIEIGTRNDMVVDVRGDVEAHNKGRLCIKGIMNREILYVRDRAVSPLIRENGELREASWEEAMSLVAERFQAAIDEDGPDSVAYYGSGQLFTQESYTANKLFKAGIGTNNVDGNPRLCMASAAVGYTSVFGKDEPMGCYEDIDHADCFFIAGANMAVAHPVLWERVLDRKRAHPNTQIIVVDPRRTQTAARADIHLAIRPASDVALLNAMLHELREEGYFDEEMIETYLQFRDGDDEVDYEAFLEHLEPFTPEYAAEICDVSASDIRQAANAFGGAAATTSLWTMGYNQQSQGTACNRLVNAMHLLTGQIGRPGATPFSLTGQPNAGGGIRDTGSLAHALPAGRVVANEAHRREMEEHWEVPEGTISPNPGHAAVAMFNAMAEGEVRCALVMGTNPAQSLPNAGPYREGMERAFLVVADAFHPTETTQLADVVLPAAMWTEKEGIFSQSERRYHHVPKLVEPLGEARSDLEILIDLAERLGHGELIQARTPEDVWDEWREIVRGGEYDFYGMTYERLQETRGLLWPCPDEDHPGTCRRYVPGEDPLANGEGRFDFYGRADGRPVIFLHEQNPFDEEASEDYPFLLNTGRVLEHWHTETITGRVEALEAIRSDFVQIHPRDARRLGIEADDDVRVHNERGEATFRAQITDIVRPGEVFATFHSAEHLVNLLTNDLVDPFSRQPEYKRAAVALERLMGGSA